MEYTPELTKALTELKRLTGMTMDVLLASPADTAEALNQIRCLITAYREKYNKNDFLQSLMTGHIPAYDVHERAGRLHIEPDLPRIMLLIETKSAMADTVTEILKNLFASRDKTLLVPVTEHQIAVLRPLKAKEDDCEIVRLCNMIVDTLNMEALVQVHIAYSDVLHSLFELSAAYRENALALKVGKLFYSDRRVFAHNKLGIGRLIYKLPMLVCENFLNEIFGEEVPASFDDETTNIINKFIQNNLNIAETSRQLHMHRNTLIYRLEQMEKRTGLDLRKFEDALTFRIATMVLNYLHTERNSQNE